MSAKKKITHIIKLQLPAGKASPSPPVGPALGPSGINIMAFCKDFNARSAPLGDTITRVVLTVYADRSYSFILKSPPASVLIKKVVGLPSGKKPGSGSKEPNKIKVGTMTTEQLRGVAKEKLGDMNTTDLEAAMRSIAGTAKSLGVDIVS